MLRPRYISDPKIKGAEPTIRLGGRRRQPEFAYQDAMRLNWFEDRMYSDPFTTEVVPYEIWSLHSLPPEVKF